MKQPIITVVGLSQRTLDIPPFNYVNLILAIVKNLCVCGVCVCAAVNTRHTRCNGY